MTPSNLKCEYLVDPLGIDATTPRLSWNLDSFSRGQAQSAYQILVGSSFSELEENRGSLWDSGKVTDAETLHIPYGGTSLLSAQRCYWKVRVWDQSDQEFPYSQPAVWEMGLLAPEEWHGKWIGATVVTEAQPAPLLRRSFTLEGSVKEARLFVAGLGYSELHVNGRSITDARLEPGFTRYDKRVLYACYDVTEQLKSGANAIGAILGNGWYNVHQNNIWKHENAPWRAAPKMLLELRVEFYDGTTTTLSSDDLWKTAPSPILWNSIYGGESYDARLEVAEWADAEFDDSGWAPVLVVDGPAGKLAAQMIPPIKVNQNLRPAGLTQPKPGIHVYDMGQNFAGFVELAINAPAGTEITLKFGERLAEDGTVDRGLIQQFISTAEAPARFQTDVYTAKGGEELEVWSPRFTYHGLQYVEVTVRTAEEAEEQRVAEIEAMAEGAAEEGAGAPSIVDSPDGAVLIVDEPEAAPEADAELEPGVTHIPGLTLTLDSISGQVINTSVTPVGVFMSSNELLNKIWQNTRWSYLSNLQSIPTDCPHREKNGWTGDAHLAADTGIYNFDGGAFYTKWLNDLQDEQREDGALPGVVPTGGYGYEWGNGPAWDSAYPIIAWDLYHYYGDSRIQAVHYDSLKRYVDYLTTRAEDGIVAIGLGDWAKYETDTPVEVTDTGYYFVNATLLADAAGRLGKTDDAAAYGALAATIRAAFNAKFYEAETGSYANGSQTALSCAVYQKLVEEENIPKVIENLVKSIEARDWHLDAGILGTKYIMNVLSDHGRIDVAYRLATQTTLPSWGHWLENGATTLYESWTDIDSRNHIMFGDIGAWFFRYLAGIQASSPGFRTSTIKPHIVGDLVHASGIYDSIVGRIVSDWRVSEGNLILFVQIPSNTTATVCVPTTDASKITEGGRPLAEVEEIKSAGQEEGYAVLSLPPGRYMFSGPYVK